MVIAITIAIKNRSGKIGDRFSCRNRIPFFCFVETSMNQSGSHPNHENRQIIISTVLIRRGGVPSGAAAFIIFGDMGVSTPISNSRKPIIMGNHS